MAAYHSTVKTISRSKGRSATAAAAYRAGERIHDERTGLDHDYRRKSGVSHTELFTPANAPEWANDRKKLWNAAEQKETRKNSTVAREFEVAFPHEFDEEQRKEVARQYCQELRDRHKCAVDLAMHEPGKEGDNRNHHAHILCTTRRMDENGLTEKTRELDNQRSGEIERWRDRWAEINADILKRSGYEQEADRFRHGHLKLAKQVELARERGDHEFVKQNENREPTKHLGPKATAIERNGQNSDRGNTNRDIETRNSSVVALAETQAEIRQLQQEKQRQQEQNKPQPKSQDNWQEREKTILKNQEELFKLEQQKQQLNQQLTKDKEIAEKPVMTYDEHVKNDEKLRDYQEQVAHHQTQYSENKRQVEAYENGGLWSRAKVRLAEKGYLTFGKTAEAIQDRDKSEQAIARWEARRDKREDHLYNSPLEKQRINKLIAKQEHQQTQAHFDCMSHNRKIQDVDQRYDHVAKDTQGLVDRENQEAQPYNQEQIQKLNSVEQQIKNTEKTLEKSPERLPRKKNNEPLNKMEAAQHLPKFKEYNREWHEKHKAKIDEWKAFEQKKPELAERLKNGTTKTRYKLYEELKAAKAERHTTLHRHANDPKNTKAIKEIQQRYDREGALENSRQRLAQLKQERERITEKPARGGWRDVKDAQKQIKSKGLHNASNKKMLSEEKRSTIKNESDREKYASQRRSRKSNSRYRGR